VNDAEYWDKVFDLSYIDNGDGNIAVSVNWYKVREIVKRFLDYNLLKCSVLELGGGFCCVAASLRAAGNLGRYISLDISPGVCRQAAAANRVQTKVGSACEIPFADNEFDAIFALDVLEHINPVKRKDAYCEINRVLKDDGKIFINNPLTESEHNPNFDFGFDFFDLCKFIETMDMRITMLDEYSVMPYFYQFIVLDRGEARCTGINPSQSP
jgi:SAM-dependent methyltransferase